MKAEIISIGSELTSGQNLDTNSQWLSLRLGEMGIPVRFHTTLADDLAENVGALKVALGRAQLIICTGGLGPTLDDLTREAMAQVASAPLLEDPASLQHIEEMFARRGRIMPEANKVQALFPQGSEPIFNSMGTAPGIWMVVGGSVIVAMPGVPTEMFVMFEKEVKPRIQRWAGSTGVIIQRKINCFGAGESAIEEKLRDITCRGHVPEVGITVSDAVISLRIVAHAPTAEAARAQIDPIEETIRRRLGELVFGVEQEDLQDAVVALLRAHHCTIAVAESVTGGLLAYRLATVPGVSQFFRGGVIAYENSVKVEALAVPSELIEQHGAVSVPVVEAMAIGCRTRFRTDLGLSTVGLAGPGGATPDKPIGLAYAAVAWDGGVRSVPLNWIGTRADIQSRTARAALNLARLQLRAMT